MFSLFALVLFSLSLFMTPPVADISAEEPLTNPNSFTLHNPQTIADYPVNYTQVDWNLGTVNNEHNNTWSDNHYRYGPTINWHTRNATDSSLIGWQDAIAIDEYVDFIVEIPYSALGGQTPVGLYLMGQYFNMSALSGSEGEFYNQPNQPNMWMVYYNITGDFWMFYSSTNATWPQGIPELESGFTLSDIWGAPVDPYLEVDAGHLGYIAGAESYWANVRVRFNASTIGGFYTVMCGVQDQQFNSIAESRFEEFKSGRIVGTTFDFLVDQAVGGYYNWERVSDDGSTLHSATRGVDFNMTATITNGTVLDNATVVFRIPHQIETQNWVYGPYTVTEEIMGVWEYDNVTETYWWNAGKIVNWTTQKEGFHYEEGYTWLDTGREYTFVEHGGFITTRWTDGLAAIVYDFEDDTFTTYLAYRYENYTFVDDDWYRNEWLGYEPWPMDGSIPLPFVVNETTSESYWNNTKLVVTFRGHIGPDILPTNEEENGPMDTWEVILDINGRRLAPIVHLPISPPELAAEYQMIHSLAVESPVSLVTLTHDGEPYQPDWMFQNDVGETFTVKSWLQGGADYFEEIDGVGFFMHAYQDQWGFDGMYDWNQWTEVEIQVRIDPHGAVDVDVYNRTIRTQWSYGEHWDWIMVEVMPGRWEPQWSLVDDWFWEENTWDFIANDWTPGWLSMQSPNCRMPVNWINVENVMTNVIGNDLAVVFDIVPIGELPQLEWNWKYFYGDLTWVVDYESGWDEHTILGWNENTVYSYTNGSKLYMDEPVKAEIFRNNVTGDLYQRENVPFVDINGEIINLDPYLVTDLETTWEDNVRQEYNHTLGYDEYFITYENGTEVQVFTGSAAAVYNISLPNNDWFLGWGDIFVYTGTADIHSMLAVNGTFIVGDYASFWNGYIATFYELVDVSMVEYTYMTIANGTIPIYMVGWPENIGYNHWVMYLNGTYQPVDFWWDEMWGHYYWNNSMLYTFEWPWELMTGVYNSQPFFIPHFMTNSRVYTVVNDIEYQLPAPGIPMWSPHELNNLENIYDFANQRYFAREYAIVNGTAEEAVLHPVKGWEPTYGYEYDVWQIDTGTIYNLTDWTRDEMARLNYDHAMDYWKSLPWTTIVNGTWWTGEVEHSDWTVAYGHRDPVTFDFIEEGWLDLQTGFYDGDYQTSQIYNWNNTGFYDYVMTMGGEEFFYNMTWRATFLNITLSNGTFFYSRMEHPVAEPIDIFQWEIDQYFMVDINGTYQRWQGWMDYTAELVFVEDVIGDSYPGGGQFNFTGSYQDIISYPVDYWEWDGNQWNNQTYWEENIVPHDYSFLQPIANQSRYEIVELWNTPDSYRFNFPSWRFNVTGDPTEYHAYGAKEVIYEAFQTQGFGMKLDYEALPITIIRSQDKIVYGTPPYGMWDHEVWTIDPLSGALDLDGDLGTTYDQFYVREIHQSTDYFNVTQQYLDVSILWEPDNATWMDEFYLHSYTGMVTFNWTYDWSELNIWTHTNGSTLNPTTVDLINQTLFDSNGYPKPGYWGISWMFENRTYADMIQQAQDEGWDWVEDNSQEWSWLWWELDEHYSTEVSNGTHSDLMDVNLAYQYAGMFAWNDTSLDNFMNITTNNEITHYWMPVDVDAVNFTTPGEGWGNYATTGSEYRGVNERGSSCWFRLC